MKIEKNDKSLLSFLNNKNVLVKDSWKCTAGPARARKQSLHLGRSGGSSERFGRVACLRWSWEARRRRGAFLVMEAVLVVVNRSLWWYLFSKHKIIENLIKTSNNNQLISQTINRNDFEIFLLVWNNLWI